MTDLLLVARRRRIGAALPLENALLLIGAGGPVPLPEHSDQTYPFRSHADYFYLASRECPGGVLAFDPAEAGHAPDFGWVSFVPPVTEAERVWEGRTPHPGRPLDELPAWLESRRSRRIVALGAPPAGLGAAGDAVATAAVRSALQHARREKDEAEVSRLRHAVRATGAGFAALREHLQPGVSERRLQIELEAAFCRAGATRPGYGTIVGSGPNAAVLHFEPSARVVQAGEFVLVDAGAEVDRYTADVTRTYVAGEPDPFQRDLHQLVRDAATRAIGRCRPGVEWKDIHLQAAVEMVAGLVTMGLMRGRPETLVEQEAHTLFFPHGLGHMVGLGVRDASGLAPGRRPDPRPSLRTLRMDLPLAAGYVVTVEPGIYFIPPLLNDPARRERFRDAVDWARVEPHLHRGGVRIEDNVLVTGGEPEVLTQAIPHDP